MSSAPVFSEEFYEAVVDGIKNAIGEGPMKATVYLLKFSRSTTDPSFLSQRMDTVFGPGAFVLKKVVAKELYRRLGLRFDEGGQFEFIKYLDKARDACLARKEV